MTYPGESDELAVRLAFLQRRCADRAAGRDRCDAEYLAEYPGFERVIEQELERIRAGCVDPDAERYRRIDEVGRGGMGQVWRVWDGELRRELAMKVLHARGDAQQQSGIRRRFVREARVLGMLQHPGVVPVHSLGDADGRPYFTMSLVDGESFASVIDDVHGPRRRWSLRRAVEILVRVCETMQFAHAHGVVHRDLKPDNVMVGQFGEVYVMDWGLAHVPGQDESDAGVVTGKLDAPDITQVGDVLGTPSYMSPEQARGEAAAIASDIYSIGAMLYHLLAGHMPYAVAGRRLSSGDVLQKLVQEPPPALAELASTSPGELAAVSERAMQRTVPARYASVADLAVDLRAYLESRVVSAYESGAWAETRKWVRRNRALASVGVFAFLGLVGGLVVSSIQRRQAQASSSLAQRAIHEMIAELTNQNRLGSVGAARMRRALLQRGLSYQKEFLALRGADPAAREDVIQANATAVTIHRFLGSYALGIETAARTLALIRKQLAEQPHRQDLRFLQVRLGRELAALYGRVDKPAAAAEASRRAETILDDLLARAPNNGSYKLEKALILTEVATNASNRGRYADSLEPRKAAIRILRDCAAEGEAEPRRKLGLAIANEGVTLVRLQRWSDAERSLGEAIVILKVLAAERDGANAMQALGLAYGALGVCYQNTDRVDEARSLARESTELRRKLVRRFPGAPSFRRELAAALQNHGVLLHGAQELEEAREAFTEALFEQDRVLSIAPEDKVARRYRAQHLSALCSTSLELGDHRTCARHAPSLQGAPGVRVELAASFLSRCVAAVEVDPALSEEKRAALRRDYERAAIEQLRVAVDRGIRDPSQLRGRAFRPLRANPEFRRLYDRATGR